MIGEVPALPQGEHADAKAFRALYRLVKIMLPGHFLVELVDGDYRLEQHHQPIIEGDFDDIRKYVKQRRQV